jgi:RNA polymerase sigma factor (sigma-70 family)
MPISETTDKAGRAGREWFSTTHWTTVLAAGAGQSFGSSQALEKLCRTYWYPLYAYIRRRGFESHEAEDLTQEFLARFLAGNHVAKANPIKGRFRYYLLTALNHFLSDNLDRQRAQKRGGGQPLISLDGQTAEERYRLEPRDDLSPDRLFDRRWALTVLEQVLTRLGQEYEAGDKSVLFQHLKGFLTDENGGAYSEIAQELGLSEGALRVAVHRLRRRYGELLRMEVAHTVTCPEDVPEEMAQLRAALRG